MSGGREFQTEGAATERQGFVWSSLPDWESGVEVDVYHCAIVLEMISKMLKYGLLCNVPLLGPVFPSQINLPLTSMGG